MSSNFPDSIDGPRAMKRKTITLSQQNLVGESYFYNTSLPVVLKPTVEGLSLPHWAKDNIELIKERLVTVGALLMRGFKTPTVAEFEEFLNIVAGDLVDYSYRSTPRELVSGKIYTSTGYPAHQTIPLHNELSYSRQWPMMLGFFCVHPSEDGGETPLADSRKIFARIDPELRNKFSRLQVLYARNYGDGLDLSWEDVFQTTERAEVEEFCRTAGIEWSWKSNGRLSTAQICQAVATHPQTGEQVWFNQAHLFHVSCLEPEVRDALLAGEEDELPRNTFYGDGSVIEDADLNAIRSAYEQEKVVFQWERGDVLLVDNMLVAHGRRPYRGERKVVVGMGQIYDGVS
ncbi:MAG TPA: TauD/TfdA family dioxygenase [Pyrinomonadaceae bacterium]|nr:TauD/TfdA family dioxygenase [Pyrinomonadaceae bacterium]